MATRAIESRFERLSVNDENDPGERDTYKEPQYGLKSKVSITLSTLTTLYSNSRRWSPRLLPSLRKVRAAATS